MVHCCVLVHSGYLIVKILESSNRVFLHHRWLTSTTARATTVHSYCAISSGTGRNQSGTTTSRWPSVPPPTERNLEKEKKIKSVGLGYYLSFLLSQIETPKPQFKIGQGKAAENASIPGRKSRPSPLVARCLTILSQRRIPPPFACICVSCLPSHSSNGHLLSRSRSLLLLLLLPVLQVRGRAWLTLLVVLVLAVFDQSDRNKREEAERDRYNRNSREEKRRERGCCCVLLRYSLWIWGL